MIIPKRRVIFYGILLTTVAWLYLASYYLLTIDTSQPDENDNSARQSGHLITHEFVKNGRTYFNITVYANYDSTPDRNPDKPGEWGTGVTLNFVEKKEEQKGYDRYAFNRVASDKISLQRNLLDVRNSKYVCISHTFTQKLF